MSESVNELVNWINLQDATQAQLEALARHSAAIRQERLPNDPPPTLTDLVTQWQARAREGWLAAIWEGEEVVALASFTAAQSGPIQGEITVLAAYRRRGLARQLLVAAVPKLEAAGHHRFTFATSSLIPAGEVVAQHLGAKRLMHQQFMELDLSSLLPENLQASLRSHTEAAPEYRVWAHEGSYPETDLPHITAVYDLMRTAPTGAKEAPPAVTVEHLRHEDADLQLRGHQRLTSFAQHIPSGQLVAFSELLWATSRPEILVQHGTAVHPDHRRHSLGRWIKENNLLTVLNNHPAARVVRAGNTDDNVGMLKINQALGFRTYAHHIDWEIDVHKLADWLAQ